MHKSNPTIAIVLACLLPAGACSFVAKTTGLGLGDKSSTATATAPTPAAPQASRSEPAPASATGSVPGATTPTAALEQDPAPTKTAKPPVAATPAPTKEAKPVAATRIALKPDDGFTGPVHQKFKGQFFFSTKEVSKTPAENAFHTTFDASESVFFRVFLDGSWGNALRKEGIDCSYRLEQPYRSLGVKVNGGKRIGLDWRKTHEDGFDEGTYFVPNNDVKKAINHGPIAYPEDKDTPYRKWAGEVVPQLKVGENTLEFSAKAVCMVMNEGRKEVEVASGSITVNLASEKARTSWYKKKGPKLPREKFKGAKKFYKHIKKALVARFGAAEKAHNLSITSKDWYIVRNKYSGRAVKRTLNAIVILESPKYGCRGFDLSFTQQSLDGNRKYGDTMSIGVGSSHKLPCGTK